MTIKSDRDFENMEFAPNHGRRIAWVATSNDVINKIAHKTKARIRLFRKYKPNKGAKRRNQLR